MELTSTQTGKFKGSEARWLKSEKAVQRLKRDKPEQIDGDFFKGRRLIKRDGPINGGIYVGASAREAIVVDDVKDKKLSVVYDALLYEAKQKNADKTQLLRMVWKLVMRIMPYDKDRVAELQKEFGDDKSIALSRFIGGGQCRHQELMAGYLVERLIREKHLRGTVSVDRNSIQDIGGHGWVRYTTSRGEAIIIDPAQEYFGSLKDALADPTCWDYARPGELESGDLLRRKVKSRLYDRRKLEF